MDVAPGESAEEVFAAYRAAWAESNEIVRGLGDPTAPTIVPVDGRLLPMRWVLAHVTTETARHAGHADILRESLDGVTGR